MSTEFLAQVEPESLEKVWADVVREMTSHSNYRILDQLDHEIRGSFALPGYGNDWHSTLAIWRGSLYAGFHAGNSHHFRDVLNVLNQILQCHGQASQMTEI